MCVITIVFFLKNAIILCITIHEKRRRKQDKNIKPCDVPFHVKIRNN
jgi:hypothetical protein